MKVNAYLFFPGTCEQAFKFYQSVLGGEIAMMLPHTGTPAAEHTPPDWQEKILHARLDIGDQMLMGSDSPPEYQKAAQGFSVSITVEDPAEADRIFSGLTEGGQIRMPIETTFFAKQFGMLVDRFGTPWMVNCPS